MRTNSSPDQLVFRAPSSEGAAAPTAASSPVTVSHLDLLRLFHAGRPFAEREPVRPPLTPARKREIRERLLDGTYASPRVLDELVRRVIESGDL